MWCQNNMEQIPATLNTSEKARKYHFLPRKSILVLRNNSTASPLNAQWLATLMAAENELENHPRYEHRGEQVGRQTEAEGHRKSLHRTGSEQEQDDGGHDRRYVGVDNGCPSVSETLFHRRGRRLAMAQLLANTLEDQDVGVHAHADGEDHTRNSRQGQGGSAVAEESQQDNQVQDQAQVGVDAGGVVVEKHKDQHRDHADDRCPHTLADGIGAQRWSHRDLLQILDSRRQRAGAQRQRQVLGLLRTEGAGNAALIVNLLLDGGHRLYFVIEHHRQLVPYVGRGKRGEAPAAVSGQGEIDIGTAILIAAAIGGTQIGAAHRRRAADEPVHLSSFLRILRVWSGAFHQEGVRRKHAAVVLHGRLLVGIGPLDRLPDLQHGGGLHNLFHAGRIVHARQLHQDMVVGPGLTAKL